MRRITKIIIDHLVGTLVAVFFVVIFLFFGISVYVQGECLKYGYKNGRLDYSITGYCIKRVDQTDVVVLLSSLRGS